MQPLSIARWSDVPDREPIGALVGNVDLVIVRYDDDHSVLYGRCDHRGALLADGTVRGDDLVCGVHGWDYGLRTGISSYNNDERLPRFTSWIDDDQLMIDADEIGEWEREHPQPYDRSAYQGAYQDVHGAPEEPHVGAIRELAAHGLTRLGHHGPMVAMGVFLESTVELMTVLARACGHTHLAELCLDDLTTFDREMHHLAGIAYGGLDA